MNKKYLVPCIIVFLGINVTITQAQTLREKVGQMVWTSFTTTKLDDTIKVDLKKRNMGGVTLFAWNITNPSQLKLLIDSIKAYSKTACFVAVDQEGGKVARLGSSNGFAATYTANTLGTVFNKEDSTRKAASTMAGWLKQSGFNVNLAPVADVNVNPLSPAIGKLERSYSPTTATVYKHASWFINEFNKKNISTCLKHFPGHGSALQDSHLGFTDITNTWSNAEFIPYTSLFAEGYTDFVMMGHLYNAKLDIALPASLSPKVTTDILRNTLGFKGVTITDGMAMSAITANYSFETAVELAVKAGNDILLYTAATRNGTSLAANVINIIEQKVNQNIIPLSRIEESYKRIMELKRKYGIITSSNTLADNEIPSEYSLSQNYPNPFNPSTTIEFKISKGGYVSLKIYDILGREVAILVDEYKYAGNYSTLFTLNSALSSGVYFYVLKANGFSQVKKMIYQK